MRKIMTLIHCRYRLHTNASALPVFYDESAPKFLLGKDEWCLVVRASNSSSIFSQGVAPTMFCGR